MRMDGKDLAVGEEESDTGYFGQVNCSELRAVGDFL